MNLLVSVLNHKVNTFTWQWKYWPMRNKLCQQAFNQPLSEEEKTLACPYPSAFSSGCRMRMDTLTIESIHQCSCFVRWNRSGKSVAVSHPSFSKGSFKMDAGKGHISASLFWNQNGKEGIKGLVSFSLRLETKHKLKLTSWCSFSFQWTVIVHPLVKPGAVYSVW